MGLTIASYNIHRCIGLDGRVDPGRIAQVINELAADVVALQEVLEARSRETGILDRIEAEGRFRVIRGPLIWLHGSLYGNALLSRLPLVGYEAINLTLPGREPRSAIHAAFQSDPACTPVRIVATHLGLKQYERWRQVQYLVDLFEANGDGVRILMGDMNEWLLWARSERYLKAYFNRLPAPATFPACFPLLALDRIWVRPATKLAAITAHRSPLARVASDHLPVRAVIQH